MTNLDIIIVIAYMVGILAIGILAGYRKNTSSEQFFLAGKSLRWPIIGAALFTANISTIHLVGLAADGYRIGFVVGNFEWMATFTLIILGLIFVPFYLRSNITTLPEFLEKRYSPTPRMIMAVITVISALLIHIGISIYAGAMVFLYFFGIPVVWSVLGIALVAATYTIVGGLRAIVVTDAIQAGLLLAGAITLTVFAILALPDKGIHTLAELKAAVQPDQMSMLHSFRNPETGRLNEYSWVSVLLGYPILGIWYWCTDQTIVQKTLGARSMRDGQLGAVFAGGLKILPLFLMVLPGVLGYVLFHDLIEQPNDTLLVMIQELLPTGVKGLLAAGLLAAVMSTVESALNSTATVVAEDIVKRVRPQTSDRSLVTIGRVTAVIVVILAILWSPYGGKFASIFEAINKIPMMFAPAITCVFLFGIFWRRGTKEAAVTTLIFGLVVGVAYFLVDLPLVGETRLVADTWGIPFMQVGWWLFCLCSVVYVVTSLMTPAPTQAHVDALHWEPPMRALFGSRITGLTDPRAVSIGLLVLMAVLYAWFS
ncbi:MAG: sodium:solute symporter [Bacteroidetes bacterium]|nr:sodium:solute symporter [Bacteroidota bacterium]